MATTGNRRDVRLGVEIETAGEENLKRIAAEVRALAKAGGDAAPQYVELADAIERNADVARELVVFKTAAEAIKQTSEASEQATLNAQRLRQEYEQQAEATEALKASQAGIRSQLDATNRAINEQTQVLAQAKAALKTSKDDTGLLAKAAADAESSLAAFKRQAADLGIDLKNSNREVKTAESTLRKLADESLNADQSARSLAAGLRSQADAMERAQRAAAELDADFTDVAAAQERLDRALRDGLGMLEAASAAEKLAAEQREAQAAVDALTADLDKQAETVRGKLVPSMLAASEAYEREQAAIRESLALAKQEEASSQRKAALAARLAQLRAEEAADLRGEIAERQRAQAVAESELATIRESEQFLASYNDRKREAALEALRFVESLEQEAAAADKANRRMAELNAQAEKTKQGSAYVRELAAAFDAAEKQAAEAAAQVQRLQGYFDRLKTNEDVVAKAFGATGLRSIQAIEREMFNTTRALVVLQGEFAAGRISLADFERATGGAQTKLAALKREIETIPGNASVFNQLAEGANNMITKFGALGAAVATVAFAVKPVIDAFIALESTTRILTQVTGSAESAAKQIEFLRKTAFASGQSFTEVSQTYAKFAASALQAGISVEQTQEAFKAVSLAAGNLGLSSDQAKRALEALSQIASKGTVSMEELRQQLGDALPGALPALAKELGLTGKELNTLVESGGLLADQAIPAITRALATLAPADGFVNGLVASFNRFVGVLKEAGTIIADGAYGRALGATLAVAGAAVERLIFAVTVFGETFTVVGKSIGTVIAALVSGDFKNLGQALNDITAESDAKLKGLASRLSGLSEPAGQAAASTRDLAAAVPQVTGAADAAAGATARMSAGVAAAGQASQASVPQHQAAAGAVAQAGQAADGAAKSYFQLQARLGEQIAAAEAQAQVAGRLSDAAKTQAESITRVAALTGDETRAKLASVQAAGVLLEAQRKEQEAAQALLALRVRQREEAEKDAIARGVEAAEREKLLAGFDALIAKQDAQVTKLREVAEATRLQRVEAELQIQTQKDNTASYALFSAAVEETRKALISATNVFQQSGLGRERVARLTEQLAREERLLRDAIDDTAAAAERGNVARRAEQAVVNAGLQQKLAEQQAALRMAELLGNETAARDAKRKIAEIELEITRSSATAKRNEADETIRATEQQIEELRVSQQLNPVLEAELRLKIELAKAARGEADATLTTVAAKEKELRVRERLANQAKPTPSSSSPSSSPGANGRTPNALAGINGAFQADARDEFGRTAAQREALSKQGGPVDNSYVFALQDRLRRGDTFSPDEVPAIQAALKAAETNARLTTGSTVQGLNGQRGATADVIALRQVLARAQGSALGSSGGATGAGSLGGAGGASGVGSLGGGFVAPASAAASPTAAASAGRTVNINLAGLGATSIRVASDADAAKVEAVLRQIETAMARSGG